MRAGGRRLFVRPACHVLGLGAERFQACADVADEAARRLVHVVGVGNRRELQHAGAAGPRIAPAGAHLNRVVAGEDHQIALLHERQQQRIRLRRESGGTETERIILGDDPLCLVGREQRDVLLPREGGDGGLGTLTENVDARHQQRPLGVAQPSARLVEGRTRGRRAAHRVHPAGGDIVGLLRRGDADGYVDQHGSRLIVGGDGERLVDDDIGGGVADRERRLGDRREQRAVIEYLVRVGQGVVRVDAAGEKDHRHAVLPGIGDDVDGVGDAGA